MNRSIICIIGWILIISSCQIETKDHHPITIQLEVSEGTNIAMDLSDSADKIVFDLQGTLWIMDHEGGNAIPITSPIADARQPSFNSDGKKICFQGYYGSNWQIYIIDQDGTKLNQITSGLYDHREPHWSNDQTITFSSDRNGSYDIWQYHIPTQVLKPLTDNDTEEYAPSTSSSGDQLSYISFDGDQYKIIVKELDQESLNEAYTSSNKLYATSWSKNDKFIYFVEHDWINITLKRVEITTREVTTLSQESQDVFPFRAHLTDQNIYYSSDGKIMKHSLENDTISVIPFKANIQLKKTSYTKKVRNFDLASKQRIKGIHCPKIAPNAKWISFISLGDVWIQHIASEDLIRITNDSFIQLMPNWSNDSQRLYYASDHQGYTALYEYDLNSKQTKEIGRIATMPSGLALSPDDKSIAYTMAFGPRSGIVSIMDIESGLSTKVGKNLPFSSSSPSWTSDGGALWVSILQPYSKLYREGIARIIEIDINTGKIENIPAPENTSYGARTNDNPTLSKDGKELLFISQGLLWIQSIDHNLPIGSPKQITYDLSDSPSWSNDTEHILYLSGDQLKLYDRKNNSTKDLYIKIHSRRKWEDNTTLITGGTIIDVVNKRKITNKNILIRKNRIVRIIDKNDSPIKAEKVINAEGKYILPGLIDIHAHQGSDLGTSLGYKWLSWGVTTTRDPATYPYDAVNRKEAQINGNLIHPRIFFTGSPIDGNRVYYNGTYAQQSKEQITRELKRAIALDYDLIKTYVRLPDSLQSYVLDFAHQHGIPMSSHELYPAAHYGVDGVEHIMGTSRRGYSPKMSETYRSYQDVIDIISYSEMSFTPTIGIYSGYNYMLAKYPELLNDARIQSLENEFNKSVSSAGIDQVNADLEKWTEMFNRQAALIFKIHANGGLIVAGTDSPIIPYGFGLFVELLCYQEGGLSPFSTLQTATINSAKAMGIDEHLGSIEEGKLADLLILNQDPTKDVKFLKSIEHTILDGQEISIPILN